MATYSGVFDNSGYTLYLDVSESDVSIANNTSVVNWTLRIVSTKALTYGSWDWDGTPYSVSIDGSVVSSGTQAYDFRNYQNLTIASGSKTITHNSDGSRSVSCSATFGNSSTPIGDASASGTFTLTTIPRASSVSGGSGNIGSSTTISITRASSSFTHTLEYAFGSLSGTIATGVGTSYTWTIPTSFYAQIPNSNSGTGTITCKTYNGSTLIGTKTCSFTASVTNSNPTVGTFTYKDSNAFTVAITENNQRIIRENSNLLFSIGTATPKNSATISKYEVTFNSVTKSRTNAGDLDFSFVNLSSNATATLKVTDSRGNTATKQITVIIDDWKLPTGIISLNRKNNFYSETYLKVDGTYSSLNGKNSMAIQYQYKKVTEKNFSELYNLTDNVQATLDLDNNYQWNIIVIVGDRIGETTYNLFLDRGMPIIFFDRLLNAVGINCFPTIAETLATSNLIQMYNGKVNAVGQKTLYDNSSGTTGTVTLSESSANFDYVEIYYKNNDDYYSSVKAFNPNGKKVILSTLTLNDENGITYFKSSIVTISGDKITFINSGHGYNGESYLSSDGTYHSPAGNPIISIIRVVGYR